MIKLVVCDVDGTLLPPRDDSLDRSVIDGIGRLLNKGINVAIASGRSCSDLKSLFEPLSDELYFICHDGALCVKSGKVLYHKPILREDVSAFAANAKGSLGGILFSGADRAFSLGGGKAAEIFKINGSDAVEQISSVFEIKDPIYKISIYKDRADFADRFSGVRACSRSEDWSEFVNRYANKGTALSDLQMRLFATYFDTAVLGNAENDVCMLKNAKLGACLPTAMPEYASRTQMSFDSPARFFDYIVSLRKD